MASQIRFSRCIVQQMVDSITCLLLGLIVSHEIGYIFFPFRRFFLHMQAYGGWFSSLLFYMVDFIHFVLHLHFVLIMIIQFKMLHNFPFSLIFVSEMKVLLVRN